jgi:hypothetical protein
MELVMGVPAAAKMMGHALLFFGDLPRPCCRQSSILIDAMRYSLPLTSLSL